MATFTPRQKNWRWCANDDAQNPTPHQNENVAHTLANNNDIIRLRVNCAEIGGKADNTVILALQYDTDSGFSNPQDVGTFLNPTCHFTWADGAGVEGQTVTTRLLSDTAGTSGEFCESSGNSVAIASSSANEEDFAIVPTGYITSGTTYYFRISGDYTWALDTGETSPQLTSATVLLDYTWTGTLATAGTMASTRAITKKISWSQTGSGIWESPSSYSQQLDYTFTGNLSAIATFATTSSKLKLYVGNISTEAYLAGARTVNIVRKGGLSFEATLESPHDFAGVLNYTFAGTISAGASFASTKTIKAVRTGSISSVATLAAVRTIAKKISWNQSSSAWYESSYSKTTTSLLDYTCTGNISAEAIISGTRTINIVRTGAINAVVNYASGWSYSPAGGTPLDYTCQGSLSTEATFKSGRSITKKISWSQSASAEFLGTYSKTHQMIYNYSGTINAGAAWFSYYQKWPYNVTGNLSAEASWASSASVPAGIYAVPGYPGMLVDVGYPGMSGEPYYIVTYTGAINALANWISVYSKSYQIPTTLNYTCIGAISSEITIGSERTVLRVYVGKISATGELFSGLSFIKTIEGEISAEATFESESSFVRIVYLYSGQISYSGTWKSGAEFIHIHIPLSFTQTGALSAVASFASDRSIIKTETGVLSAGMTFASTARLRSGTGTKYEIEPITGRSWQLHGKPALSTAGEGAYTVTGTDGAITEINADGAYTEPGDGWTPTYMTQIATWTTTDKGELP